MDGPLSSWWPRLFCLCWAVLGALFPMATQAQEDFQGALAEARRLYEELEYEQALVQLQWAKPRARTPEQEVALGLLEGIVLGDMGERGPSLAAFHAALLLDPEAKLPLKVAPKVARDFEEMRRRARADLLKKQPPVSAPSQEVPPSVSAPRQSLKPDLTPPPVRSPAPYAPVAETQARSGRRVLPWALAGAGAVALGVGTVFGLKSRASVSDARNGVFLDETRAHLEDARGSAGVANVLFGVAGAASAAALGTWLLAPGASSKAPVTEAP
ncbi:tetratricopeptide repeat protein [Stigmatella aurantiaca]|nr:tetratricopeptide repeat protein [Stigmatella aurantiaca]